MNDKLKVLNITNYNHGVLGGVENYNRKIYECFPNFTFFEIPLLKSKKDNMLPKIKNVKIIDDINFFQPILTSNNILTKLNKVRNRNSQMNDISDEIENIIRKENIDIILVNTTYFFNKYFFNKYKENLVLVQHVSPEFYFHDFNFIDDWKQVKMSLLKRILNFWIKIRFPIINHIKYFVVFDKVNEDIFKKKYKNKKITFFPINIPSEYSVCDIKKNIKKYDFVSPIRLEKQKNIDGLVDFAKDNPNYKFVICGEGSDVDKIKHIKNIYYMGKLNKSELKKVMCSSKYVLLFSFYEGFPTCISEGFSLGVPAISTNTYPSSKYLIGDNLDRGFIFDLNNTNEINKFIESNDYLTTSNNCLRFSKENLTLDKFRESWKKVISFIKE